MARICPECGHAVGHHTKCSYYEYSNGSGMFKDEQAKPDPIEEPGLSRKRAAELLMHAAELINGQRAQDYGEPQQSFENIARLWSTYLHQEITVTDVGMMMILLKVSRNQRGKDKQDNFVDICGYASLVGSRIFNNESK
jgi:hypothetical protein